MNDILNASEDESIERRQLRSIGLGFLCPCIFLRLDRCESWEQILWGCGDRPLDHWILSLGIFFLWVLGNISECVIILFFPSMGAN